MVARNFDYLPLIQPYYLIRESRPQGRLRAFEFTTAPLVGAVDGMNEAGLCITYNYGFTTDVLEHHGLPAVLSEIATHPRIIFQCLSGQVSGSGTLTHCQDGLPASPFRTDECLRDSEFRGFTSNRE